MGHAALARLSASSPETSGSAALESRAQPPRLVAGSLVAGASAQEFSGNPGVSLNVPPSLALVALRVAGLALVLTEAMLDPVAESAAAVAGARLAVRAMFARTAPAGAKSAAFVVSAIAASAMPASAIGEHASDANGGGGNGSAQWLTTVELASMADGSEPPLTPGERQQRVNQGALGVEASPTRAPRPSWAWLLLFAALAFRYRREYL